MPLRLAFGDFELDEPRFELRLRGRAVAVQPKVLDLIFYLARHRERVVPKEELLDTVWKGIAVTEASLSQAVSLARRALEDTPEEQHTLRTVRSKGFQFVAPAQASAPPALAAAPLLPRPVPAAVATLMETAEDVSARPAAGGDEPYLFAALHCEAPSLGGAGWSLGGVDEVEIGRGSERRSALKSGPTRVLTISVPGRLLSRRHARIVRTPHGFLLVDEGSRNGTFVGGERVDKRLLAAGDAVDCGRTLFRFTSEPAARDDGAEPAPAAAESILGSVTPWVLRLERDLRRVAASDVPVLLVGESGTGKTHVAQAIHRLSGRGTLVRVEAGAVSDIDIEAKRAEGRGPMTLLIEGLERAEGHAIAKLHRILDTLSDVRVIGTSLVLNSALAERLPTDVELRIGGFTCELPPLRRRIGDLGVLAGRLAGGLGQPFEIDIEAGRALLAHHWPGNVRELANRLKVAATLSAGEPMRLEHLLPQPA